MIIIYLSFLYITSDPFFWPSMSFTTLIGIFIGSVIYDGDVNQVKKAIITLASYCTMISVSNLSRVIPQIPITSSDKLHQPLAGITTIALVTVFYLLGMFLGVVITKRAHRKL